MAVVMRLQRLGDEELGPEDYDLLLGLDEAVRATAAPPDVLSMSGALALRSSLGGDGECAICLDPLGEEEGGEAAGGAEGTVLPCG